MVSQRHERISEVFLAVCELPAEERAKALNEQCADDPSLRSEVEALLARDAEDDSAFLQSPALGEGFSVQPSAAGVEPEPSLVGKRISHYHLTRVIASGGMGTVYEAQQDEPRRTLAVKVMKRGITSQSALKRFEYESQILAHLRHPGIAHVYEAGRYEEGGGVPYFAMELIADAKPITDYAKDRKLNTRSRLDLFTKVCDAVHHGHQKGVIHRDLKPSNILVDGQGEPKIIDFGVARATDSDLAITTLQTDVGQLIGTLQYMSPEQCVGNAHDLDTRSDVYSLGVVLYELLCDRAPYDVSSGTVPQAIQVIREETPTRPSTINRTLRGDLETITLKALEKERQRRYDSASALADDIRRYLNDEPIIARPASAMYQFRKFSRRNKGLVVGVCGMIVALFIVVATLAIKNAEIRNALGQLSEANQELSREREEAQLARRRAEEMFDFLALDILWSVVPSDLGESATVRDALDAAAERVDERFAEEPLIAASLHQIIGTTYSELGVYEQAEAHHLRSIEIYQQEGVPQSEGAIESAAELAVLYVTQSRYKEAITISDEAVKAARESLGVHRLTALALGPRGRAELAIGDPAKAMEYFLEAIEILKQTTGEDSTIYGQSLSNLAVSYRLQGRLDEAQITLEAAIKIVEASEGRDDALTLTLRNNLGVLYRAQGDYESAVVVYEDIVPLFEQTYPLNHPNVFFIKAGLAGSLDGVGRLEEALVIYEQMLPFLRQEMPQDWLTLMVLNNLGNLYHKLDRLDDSRLILEEAIEGLIITIGADHRNTLKCMSVLAFVLSLQEKFEESETVYVELVSLSAGRYLDMDPMTIGYRLRFVTNCLIPNRRYSEAENQLSISYDSVNQADENDNHMRSTIVNFVKLYEAWDKPEEAAQWRAKLDAPADD